MAIQTSNWVGVSGNCYVHTIIDLLFSQDLTAILNVYNNVNYVFVKKQGLDYIPLYFGEAESLLERILGHEKWERAINLGINQIHASFTSTNKSQRTAIETDLRRMHRTPLNDQPTGQGLFGL